MLVEPELQRWMQEIGLGPQSRLYTKELADAGITTPEGLLRLDHAGFQKLGLQGKDIEAVLLGNLKYILLSLEARGVEEILLHLEQFIHDWPGHTQLMDRENRRPLNARLHEQREAESRGEDIYLGKLSALDPQLARVALLQRLLNEHQAYLSDHIYHLTLNILHETVDAELRATARAIALEKNLAIIEPVEPRAKPLHPVRQSAFHGHHGVVNSIHLSGKTLASASDDGSVIVWNVSTGKILHQLHGHEGAVLAVDIRENRIISGGRDRTVQLWSVENGKSLWSKQEHEQWISSVRFSQDGTKVFSASADHTIIVWEAGSGEKIRSLTGHAAAVTALSLTEDPDILCSGSADKSIRFWKISTGETLQTLSAVVPAKAYDVKLRHPQPPPPNSHTDEVTAITCMGDWVVTGCRDSIVRAWSRTKGACVHTLTGHMGSVTAVLLSDDAKLLISAGADGTLRLWDMRSGSLLRTVESSSVAANCLTGNGTLSLVITGGWDHSIRTWDLLHGQQPAPMRTPSHATHIRSLPHEQSVAVGHQNGVISILRLNSEITPVKSIKAHEGKLLALATCEASSLILSAGDDDLIHLWKPTSTSPKHTFGPLESTVTTLGFGKNGQLLASGHADGTIRIWGVDAQSHTSILTQSTSPIIRLEWLIDDSRLMAVSRDGSISFWHTRAERLIDSLQLDTPITAARISGTERDFKILVGLSNGALHLIDFEQKTALWESRPHTDSVSALSGGLKNQILSSSLDGSLSLSRKDDGQLLCHLHTEEIIRSMTSANAQGLFACAHHGGLELLKITVATPTRR